jgi:hypothetical protein
MGLEELEADIQGARGNQPAALRAFVAERIAPVAGIL